jgi:NifB/MoaA-like Fe-S oxidoreductase
VNAFGNACLAHYGSRLFFPSDEFYLKAGRELPDDDFYESYAQIENGVGMLTDLRTGFSYEMEHADDYAKDFSAPRTVSIVTGHAAYRLLRELADELQAKFEGLTVHVHPIKNEFFGDEITVAGLLTGKDMIAGLRGKELGDALLFPASTLRAEGDIFLDDLSPDDLANALGVPAIPVGNDACELIRSVLGI